MTTVNFTCADDPSSQDGSVQVYTWTPLTTTNADGGPLRFPSAADRSVHVSGTFSAAATVVIEGSNNGGTSWVTLNDAQGNALSLTAEGLKQIVELPLAVRPRISAGGDGSTSITVTIVARRPNPMRT
jgi:hypothetical protein